MKNIYMKAILLIISSICLVWLSSCKKTSDSAIEPLLGIKWFDSYDNVKNDMGKYTLLAERENNTQKIPQKMQDYTGLELFGYPCDLTLCFTDSGLIGFNYHDVEKNQDYKSWYNVLESRYGATSEEGSGMAAWFDEPVGKNTAIYLFNLEEGVQISIYATSDSPDKSYVKKDTDEIIPMVEIRTPVVSVPDDGSEGTSVIVSDETSSAVTDNGNFNKNTQTNVEDNSDTNTINDGEDTENAISDKTSSIGTSIQNSYADRASSSKKNTTADAEIITEPVKDKKKDFLLNDLSFYGSPDSEKKKMSGYKQLYEYQTEAPEQPWELITEYNNVEYLDKKLNCVLCFTSLGLVGINYSDSDTGNYDYFVQALTDIYGSPDNKKKDYTAWTNNPVGKDTMIYVVALGDSVQISFFTDDTGSELAKNMNDN